MKKVLVWIGGDLFNFPLTYYLKKKCDLEIHAIADVTLHLKKYLENQKLIKFNNLWFFQESASLNLKNPNLSFLKEIEKKYDLNLWELINTERYFDPKINTYHKFSKEEILCIIENECKFFEKILFDIKPEFLILYMPFFHYDFILYKMCKKLGIKVLLLGLARGFSKTALICEDYDKLPKHDIQKTDEKNFTSFEQLQAYLKKDDWFEETQTLKNNFMSSKKFLFKAFFTYLFSKNHNQKYYTYFGAGKIKVILRTIWVNLLEKYRFSYMENHSLKELNISEPFIFFPLHVYPEGSFVLNAPYFTNQLEIIKHISKSIPINYTLVVKEHPVMSMRGWRELSFYDEIINLPNVKLLSSLIPSDEILKKMKLIITITSTAGLEAAFYGKPSIVLVDTMYDEIPSVIKLKKIDDLSSAIKESLNKKIQPGDLNSYINSIEKKSFKCDITGLSNNLINEIFYNGFLSDVKITDEKFLKFIENNSEQFKILATNYFKLISSND
jgi:capsule polysaccharide modification protein KpsS